MIELLDEEYKLLSRNIWSIIEDFSDEEFLMWLRQDLWGNPLPLANEPSVINMLNILEPYREFESFYDICIQELIKIKNEKI